MAAVDEREAVRQGGKVVLNLVVDSKTYHLSILIVSLFSFISALRGNKNFHDGGPYHIEASSLICGANQWTGFYMMGISAMKELISKMYR